LRATGQVTSGAGQRARDALTPQEHEISMLAAAGLSNKEIGQRLFLSPKTGQPPRLRKRMIPLDALEEFLAEAR
jgi:FixJ family two-component response regulator